MRCRPRIAGKLVEGMRLIDQGHVDMGNEELWIRALENQHARVWIPSTRMSSILSQRSNRRLSRVLQFLEVFIEIGRKGLVRNWQRQKVPPALVYRIE